MPRILYKYIASGDEKEPVPIALRSQTLVASDPTTFNDPFEVRPYFDQEAYEFYVRGKEGFDERMLGVKHSLVAGHSMLEVPVERAPGFGDDLTARFRREISRRFRVVCLSDNAISPVMWAHYTQIYKGAVIGIDVEDPTFEKGLNAAGYSINYSDERSYTKLPLAYYQTPGLEAYDVNGSLCNDPMQEIMSNGLVLYFYQYIEQVEEAYLRALSTKATAWGYEKEVRFIYEVSTHERILKRSGKFFLVPIPASAFKKIIIGDHASVPMVRGIVDLYRKGAFGEAQLSYTTCHPYRFEVQVNPTEEEYLLDYFGNVLTGMRRRSAV